MRAKLENNAIVNQAKAVTGDTYNMAQKSES